MSYLAKQALENAWARAHEVGQPSILGRCLKAGMSVSEARGVVEACKDKRAPQQFCSACIARWREEG